MAFATPSPSSRRILSVTDTGTTGATTYPFSIPQDADEIVCRFYTGSQFPGALAGSANVYVQTSEDGGTTWRDVVFWNTTSTIGIQNAHFQPISCANAGFIGGAAASNWVGSVAASTLAVTSVASKAVGIASGLPMIGVLGRVQVQYQGTVASNTGINVDVFAPTTQLR